MSHPTHTCKLSLNSTHPSFMNQMLKCGYANVLWTHSSTHTGEVSLHQPRWAGLDLNSDGAVRGPHMQHMAGRKTEAMDWLQLSFCYLSHF